MATHNAVAVVAATPLVLGSSSDRQVSRWIVHVIATVGGVAVTARIPGTSDTPVAVGALQLTDNTYDASMAVTGLYEIQAGGREIILTPGTSATISATPLIG